MTSSYLGSYLSVECQMGNTPQSFRKVSGGQGRSHVTLLGLNFIWPFLCKAPPLEMRWECWEFFPEQAGKGSLLWSYEAEMGLP